MPNVFLRKYLCNQFFDMVRGKFYIYTFVWKNNEFQDKLFRKNSVK